MHKDNSTPSKARQKINTFFEPLFIRHQHYYKKSKLHLWVDVIFLLIIITLFSAILYFQLVDPKPQLEMEMTLDQDSLISGQTSTATLTYKNNGQALDDVVVAIHLPKNYELKSTHPSDSFDTRNHVFTIGHLPRGGNGSISVTGLAWGAINHEASFTYNLSYNIKGRDNSVIYNRVFTFTDSVIKTDLILPEHAFAGSVLPVKVSITNSSLLPARNLGLEFNSDWEFDEGDNLTSVKKISQLNPGETKQFSLKLKRKKNIESLSLSLATTMSLNKKQIVLNTNVATIGSAMPAVSVELQTQSRSLKNHHQLPVHLIINNKEKLAVENISLRFHTSSGNVALNDINFMSDKISKNGNTLTIKNLPANEELRVPLGVTVRQIESKNNMAFSLIADISYAIDNQIIEVDAESATIILASELNVKSVAYYFSPQGDQLGIGPLPPIVDLPTTYWVFWQADNKGNDLANFTMTGQLPAGASLTGQKSLLAGDFKYNEQTNQVSWTIEKIDKDGGDNKIGFEISITPSKKNIGQVMPILSNIKFIGDDSYAKIKLSGQLPNLTTNLRFDKNAHDNGVVTQ